MHRPAKLARVRIIECPHEGLSLQAARAAMSAGRCVGVIPYQVARQVLTEDEISAVIWVAITINAFN